MTTYFYPIILFLAWTAYLYLHSYLASSVVKRWVARKLPTLVRWYRLIYSIQSTLGIVLLLYLMARMQTEILFERSELIKAIGFSVGAFGVLIVSLAFRSFPVSTFLGFRDEPNNGLIRSGIHGRMRHPIYTGTILILIGLLLAVPTLTVLVSVLAVLLYLPLGIYWEEQKLLAVFGEDYVKYRQEVPALFPKGF